MIFDKLKNLFTGSLRRQLVVGMVLVVATMMSLFVWDQTRREQAVVLEQQSGHAVALAQSVSTSSAVWVASRDFSGLQEIINGLARYPDLQHAIVLDTKGQVLAHADASRVGLFMTDLPPHPVLKFLGQDAAMVDIVNPIILADKHIGWVRIGLGQQKIARQLAQITRNGILYTLLAVVLAAMLATLASRRLTRRLYAIQSVADAVQLGRSDLRATIGGTDEAAQLARQFNTMLDTLAKREAEIVHSHDALEQSESRLKQVMAVTGEGIWDWDLISNRVRHNSSWCAILGLDSGYMEHPADFFITLLHENDREKVMARIQDCLAGKGRYSSEHCMYRADGRVIWVQDRGDVVERDSEGRAIRMLGSSIDITERKRMEAALQQERDFAASIVDTAPVIILLLDTQGIIQHVNPFFEQLTGYRLNEIKGREWFSIFLPTRDQDRIRALFRSAAIGEPTRGNINTIITRSGEEREIEWNDQALRDVDGTITGLLAIGQDVTALRKLNQELEQRVDQRTADMKAAKDEAERANMAKSEFLSRMSHELRTPLNAVLGFGQLLESDPDHPLTESQVDNVREILHAGSHLLELVNEVLDLSRIESGRLEVSLESIPVDAMIKACLAQIQPLAAQRGIDIDPAQGVPCSVQADWTRLKQVLLNLLSNAVKYNREGGRVQVSWAPSGEHRLRISIRDTGHGIAAEALPRLFKPFERLESAYEGIEGTGIGLALSKKLVVAMHGEIGVETEPGKGSTFWFELPLHTMDEEAAVTADLSIQPLVTSGATRKTLLYIEDNPANLRLVKKIISTRKTLDLLDAVNAEDGLEIALRQHPDLILLDINLPGMNGFEALSRLRENSATRDIPVVAVTANAMPRDVERGKAAGFREYLTKPLDMSEFLKMLDHCLPACEETES
ncbi:MAG: PAS domain S-box protein [Thiobacillus sp.]|nr:PAS domain S-box protein [Thiobacillus sp.]